MTLKDDILLFTAKTHADVWKRREGQKVPEASDLTLGVDAMTLDGTVLYADLKDSTGLVRSQKDWFAAEVYKNYLYAATKIIRACGGTVTAFDGDRVMAVFIGGNKNTSAISAGLKITWAVDNILQPGLNAKYPKSIFKYAQRVGIDTSPLFVARTGIRGSNDLVWVGNAANNAAKMATLSRGYSTYITESIYTGSHESAKYGGDPKRLMWTDLGVSDFGYKIYGSTWRRSF